MREAIDSTIYLVSIRMENAFIITALIYLSVTQQIFSPPCHGVEYISLSHCLGPGHETGFGQGYIYGYNSWRGLQCASSVWLGALILLPFIRRGICPV